VAHSLNQERELNPFASLAEDIHGSCPMNEVETIVGNKSSENVVE